jgi:hypothetical protein
MIYFLMKYIPMILENIGAGNRIFFFISMTLKLINNNQPISNKNQLNLELFLKFHVKLLEKIIIL